MGLYLRGDVEKDAPNPAAAHGLGHGRGGGVERRAAASLSDEDFSAQFMGARPGAASIPLLNFQDPINFPQRSRIIEPNSGAVLGWKRNSTSENTTLL